MSNDLNSLRWLFGFRRAEGRSVLPMETITLSLRAFANARFETEARDRVYQPSGWAKDGKAAVRIVRKGWWPFTPVVNIRFRPQEGGPSVVFTDGLLLDSWIKLTLFLGAVLILLATGLDGFTGQVRFGILVAIAFFVLNRWVARKDWDILVDQFMTHAGALPVEEWTREPVAAPTAPAMVQTRPLPTPASVQRPAQPSYGAPIVESGSGIFGRRRG
ncbi:MAG: hypothetical protein V4466_03675 [Pseudomonadota bacterium]